MILWSNKQEINNENSIDSFKNETTIQFASLIVFDIIGMKVRIYILTFSFGKNEIRN